MNEGMPPRRVTSAAAEGRSADYNYGREAALKAQRENLETELMQLDAQIEPLKMQLRAGENVEAELTPLLDRRGEIIRHMEKLRQAGIE